VTLVGLPTPRRRTFAAALRASAHSEVPGASASSLRWAPTPAPGAWATPPSPLLPRRGSCARLKC